MTLQLPKNLKSKIGLDLPLSDIFNLSLVSKKFHEAYLDDGFWRLKVVSEYGRYVDEKPDTMSYKVLYGRLKRSGKIWMPYVTRSPISPADHIYKYVPRDDADYYITASGNLYCYLFNDDWYHSALMLYILGEPPTNTTELIQQPKSYYVMDNIKDLVVTEYTSNESNAIILDLNHNMMTIGDYLNGFNQEGFLTTPNIREIGGISPWNFYYFITDDNALYIFDGETQIADEEAAKPILIANDVKQVSLTTKGLYGGDLTILYYTDHSTLSLHRLSANVYKNEEEFKFGPAITDYDEFEIEQRDLRNGNYIVNRKLTRLNIKDVTNFGVSENHDLFVIHSDNNLYVYSHQGNKILIDIVKPIKKLVCYWLSVAYIDMVDDLYVMGKFGLSDEVLALPVEYTLNPIFIEHDVLDVNIFGKFCILKKDKTDIFDPTL